MKWKGLIKYLLIVLTVANFGIFIFRDVFQYHPYTNRQDLYATCRNDCVNKWSKYKNDYPESELKEAKSISDSLLGSYQQSTHQKILAIGSFVYNRFKEQTGKPSSALVSASPMQQYYILVSSDTMKLWCGNFSQIFSWFCWSQGIITRNIEIMKAGNRHVLNECYTPETRQWIMTDITHNLLLVSNSKGTLLNLPDFRDSLSQLASFTVWKAIGSSVKQQQLDKKEPFLNYYMKDHPVYYYHRVDNNKVYTTADKIKMYFFPVSWYEILGNPGNNNLIFYLKELFLFLWVVTFFVFIISLTKFRI